MMRFIALALLFLCVHQSMAALDCDNTDFRDMIVGLNLFRDYMGDIYNLAGAFETMFAHGYFNGFKVIGQLSLYITMYDNVLKDASSDNQDLVAYVSLFKSLLTSVLKDHCEWLKSYNDDFSKRNISCSDPAEVALLASFIGIFSNTNQLTTTVSNSPNSCKPLLHSDDDDDEIMMYLNKTLSAEDIMTKNKIKSLH